MVFIAYGDERCAYSLKRIGKQAQRLKIFDDVILYGPDDLPEYIKQSTLMKYTYGGGYWSWKPVIIKETLNRYDEGTIVCYVDAGCTLHQSIEWTVWRQLMEDYDFIAFKYRAEYPEWERFGSSSTKIKHWGKKTTLEFLDEYVGDSAWREHNKTMGGILFVKGKNNPVIENWLDIAINHPDVILDPTKEELKEQYPYFALHKHDQVVLTALMYKYRPVTLTLPETSETCGDKAGVVASRIRAGNLKEYCELMGKHYLRKLVGGKMIERLKGIGK